MAHDERTKQLLQNLLDGVYRQQAQAAPAEHDSYLIAQDNQYLGRITDNRYDTNSILNQYGPYGSRYSSTSIFNPYSPYGSQYGQFSINNPYCSTPPKLFIQGQFFGHVSKNQHVPQLIPTGAFLYTLEHNVAALLAGQVIQSDIETKQLRGESFIVAGDGTFLGKLNPNVYDNESIFNQYGPYGNRYSQTCIFNPYSPYGGQYSNLSPFNQYANDPPKVFLKGSFFAFLTVNQYKTPRLDPDSILDWAKSHVGTYG
jgi:hypothetical protein